MGKLVLFSRDKVLLQLLLLGCNAPNQWHRSSIVLSARSSLYSDGLYLTVFLSVPLFTFTWLFSVLVLFPSSSVLEVCPFFIVAIVVCVVIGALGVWFGRSRDAGRGVLILLSRV